MRKKLYIAINRNNRRSECMCRLGMQSLTLCILRINQDRALSGSKEGVNV
jgi:hypothetical protein